METSKLIECIQEGRFRSDLIEPRLIQPAEIINISNISILRALATHKEDFKFLSETETWKKTPSRQRILFYMDRLNSFLNDVSELNCSCAAYKYNHAKPEFEEEMARVKILDKGTENFQTNFVGKCTSCSREFAVTEDYVHGS